MFKLLAVRENMFAIQDTEDGKIDVCIAPEIMRFLHLGIEIGGITPNFEQNTFTYTDEYFLPDVDDDNDEYDEDEYEEYSGYEEEYEEEYEDSDEDYEDSSEVILLKKMRSMRSSRRKTTAKLKNLSLMTMMNMTMMTTVCMNKKQLRLISYMLYSQMNRRMP